MRIMKIILIADTDFHTMGQTKGSTSDFLRDTNGVPYIPGTHIKGVMRTEAERITRSTDNIKCRITGDWDQLVDSENGTKKQVLTCEEVSKGGFGCNVCSLFGVPNTKGGGHYYEGKIRILNFSARSEIISSQRVHVSIDRGRLSNTKGALFTTRTVPSGCEFTGHIIFKDISESEERLLFASLHSMVHYGLGGERSRGLGSFSIKQIKDISIEEFHKGDGLLD